MENKQQAIKASDTIARQRAFDEIDGWIHAFKENQHMQSASDALFIKYSIAKLPPEQPQLKWETCFDCPLSHVCPKIKGCTNEQAEEYASEIPDDCPLSTQPQRMHGKWEEKNVCDDKNVIEEWQSARCSVCGKYHTTPYMYYFNDYSFCPHCGADMREEADNDSQRIDE